jgi:microsomal dipeptidase-like Zn-dependent dipeptidase
MICQTAELMGIEHVGIGTDLCQDQPDSVVEWMRVGRWTRSADFGEGSASSPGFPPMPHWFQDNRDFHVVAAGLAASGMSEADIARVMGGNWQRFFDTGFTPASVSRPCP